jgi:hypothetical protein
LTSSPNASALRDLADALDTGDQTVPLARPVQRLVWLTALAIAVAACAGATPARPKAWDQATVASISQKLPRATDLLLQAIKNESEMVQLPASFGISPEDKQFISDARAMHDEAGRLAHDLGQGKGRSETLDSFRGLEKRLEDAKVAGRQAFEVEQINDHFHQVRSLIDRLEPYYVEAD